MRLFIDSTEYDNALDTITISISDDDAKKVATIVVSYPESPHDPLQNFSRIETVIERDVILPYVNSASLAAAVLTKLESVMTEHTDIPLTLQANDEDQIEPLEFHVNAPSDPVCVPTVSM